MFCIDPAPTFEAEVPVHRLDSVEPVPLPCTFRHKTATEVIDLQRRMHAENMGDLDVLVEVLVDVEVYAPDGQRLPYSRDLLARLLDRFPNAGPSIYQGFRDALQQGRLGN